MPQVGGASEMPLLLSRKLAIRSAATRGGGVVRKRETSQSYRDAFYETVQTIDGGGERTGCLRFQLIICQHYCYFDLP